MHRRHGGFYISMGLTTVSYTHLDVYKRQDMGIHAAYESDRFVSDVQGDGSAFAAE